MEKEKLGIYIHIPFCVKKCAYCDFLSVAAREEQQEEYIRRLADEIAGFQTFAEGYEVDTVFIGGGTPSILREGQITRIMEALQKSFSIARCPEITMEGNPGTLNLEKLLEYQRAGINRLSIGLQSVHEKELKLLGRIHSYEEFLGNYGNARKAGFDNVNVDLMFGLPGQSPAHFEKSLETVISLSPAHISAYGLIIEEGTLFYERYAEEEKRREQGKTPSLLPGEEEEREMYENANRILEENGYIHYEISNYAKPGFFCRHNCKYWQRKPYLGFGIGAASLIEEKRVSNPDTFEEYGSDTLLKRIKKAVPLSAQEQMEEFLFLGLRLLDGISVREFQSKFGKPIEEIYGRELNRLMKEGLLKKEGNRLSLTERGVDVSNYVFALFLKD